MDYPDKVWFLQSSIWSCNSKPPKFQLPWTSTLSTPHSPHATTPTSNFQPHYNFPDPTPSYPFSVTQHPYTNGSTLHSEFNLLNINATNSRTLRQSPFYNQQDNANLNGLTKDQTIPSTPINSPNSNNSNFVEREPVNLPNVGLGGNTSIYNKWPKQSSPIWSLWYWQWHHCDDV